jgi:hypothetical protein
MFGFLINLFKRDTRSPAQKKADEKKKLLRQERIRSARSWYLYLEAMRERKRYLEMKEKRRKRLEEEEKAQLEAAENRSIFFALLLQLLFTMLDIILEKQRYRIRFIDPMIPKKNSSTPCKYEHRKQKDNAAKEESHVLTNASSPTPKKPPPPTAAPIKKSTPTPFDIPVLDGSKTAAEMGVIANERDLSDETNATDMSIYETMYKMLMPKGKQLVESGAAREGISNFEYLKRNEKRYREALGIDIGQEMTHEQKKKEELKKRLKNQSQGKDKSPDMSPGG